MNVKQLINQQVRKRKQAPDWFKTSFPEQIQFIKDPARFKTGLCTRRAGKSYGGGLYLFKEAYENPGVTVMYIAKTIDTAKNIMWKDVLKVIDTEFKLDCNFNDRKNRVILPNGSEIILFGADSSVDEMEKLRGQKVKLVIVDEGSTYRINLFNLIYKVLKAALWDYQGTIAMIGTPTDYVQSFFAKATMGKIRGWKNHFWTAADNPHVREQYLQEYADAKADNPNVEQEAWFMQEYMGKWVVTDKNRVFAYNFDPRIEEIDLKLNLNLGIKVDYDKDVTGFTVVGYSTKSRDAYIVETQTLESTDVAHIAKVLTTYTDSHDFSSITLVGMSKKLIEQFRSRYPVSIPDDIEKDETAIIRLYQSELLQNHIKVLPQATDIVTEWDGIVKDTTPKFQFHPSCTTHCTQASLYAWLYCYNYLYEPEQESDDPNDEYWEREAERITNSRGVGDLSEDYEEESGDFPENWWI